MRRIAFYSIMIFVFLLFMEISSYISMCFLQHRGLFYYPFKVSASEYANYLKIRDPFLGWPSTKELEHCDKSGSRPIPEFPDPDKYQACISLYGDSFTWAAEVDEVHAWGNVLSKLVNCRVSNFGVGGYGTDQAYLRFHYNHQDKSKIVILGFFTENIMRNLSQYRYLTWGWKFTLKPRFILDNDGQLKLIPLPTFDYEQFVDLLNHPDNYLKYEYFLPGEKSGVYRIAFPYTLTLVKGLVKNPRIRAKIKDVPVYADYYSMEHPSQAILITFGIINKFWCEAIDRHKKPIILIIPTGFDIHYFKEHKKWPYENIVTMLKAHKLDFIDAGPEMMLYSKDRDPCELFYDCAGHYNIEGYKVLAEIVYSHIKEDMRGN